MRLTPLQQLEIKRDALRRQLGVVESAIELAEQAEERRAETVEERAAEMRRSPEYTI